MLVAAVITQFQMNCHLMVRAQGGIGQRVEYPSDYVSAGGSAVTASRLVTACTSRVSIWFKRDIIVVENYFERKRLRLD
jgi:hypothetical protein